MKNGEEEKKNKKRNERTNKTDSSIGPAVQSHSLVNLFFFPFFLSLQSFYIKPSAFTCVVNHYIPFSLSLSPSMCLIYLKPDCCSPLMLLFSFHPIYGPPFSFFFFLFLKFPQEEEEGKGKGKKEEVGCPLVVGWLKPTRTPSSTSPSCGHPAKWWYTSGHSTGWINSSPDLLVSASRRVNWPKKGKEKTSKSFDSPHQLVSGFSIAHTNTNNSARLTPICW